MIRSKQVLCIGAITLGLLAFSQVPRNDVSRVKAAPLEHVPRALLPGVPSAPELEVPSELDGLARRVASPGRADAAVADAGRDETVVAQPRWTEIVAELRELAEQPRTFHQEALGRIDVLGALADRPGEADALLAEVVHSVDEPPLVRGAVLMAIAGVLPEFTFRITLDDWFAVDTTPLELLRAGAIAAARRGDASSCSLPLSLTELAKLQFKSSPALPGIYPVELHGLVGSYEAAMLEEWLGRPDARQELFHIAGQPPADPDNPDAVGEYFVTAELLFALWGHRSLQDPHIESRVLREATLGGAGTPEGSVLYFRPASLVVYSLALCNEKMFDLATTLGESSNHLLSSMAMQMEVLAGSGPLGVALMAKIESLRYESEMRFDLTLILADVGERMTALGAGEAHLVSQACLYLDGLVQDSAVDETARGTALTAIRDSGSWPHIKGSASTALYADSPDAVSAIAAVMLVRAARAQPHLRTEVLEILRQAKSKVTKAWLLRDLDTFITELSGA